MKKNKATFVIEPQKVLNESTLILSFSACFDSKMEIKATKMAFMALDLGLGAVR